MKVLIIFLAMLILNVTFFIYQSDMNHYVQTQKRLKWIAQECAGGAALYFDEEEFSNGRLVANQAEGLKYIEYTIQKNRKGKDVYYESYFFDQREGIDYPFSFQLKEGKSVQIEYPCVIVSIREQRDDYFRLPFLSENEALGETLYELKGK